jgi:toxin ParE1/3/4
VTFGEYQADAYHAGLERTFGLLSDFPRMAPRVEGARPEVRSFRFQSHVIVYSEELGHIVIRAVMHYAQDWRRASY